MTRNKIIPGQRFGRLIVVRQTEVINSHHDRIWECLCDCGTPKHASTNHLRSKSTKSCGCLKRETDIAKGKIIQASGVLTTKKPFGEASFNVLYGQYRSNAKKRNIELGLTKEEFKIFTKQNCFYCGIEPKQKCIAHQTNPKHKTNGEYIYNGIDRCDSSKGYTLDNCVACCGKCNEAKNSLNVNEFYAYIEKVYNFLKDTDRI